MTRTIPTRLVTIDATKTAAPPAIALAATLDAWYAEHRMDGRPPWRRHREPLDRVAMVEGCLVQTQGATVIEHYPRVFRGVRRAEDWLALTMQERIDRVAPMGLPRTKFWAVTRIAEALVARRHGDGGAVDAERLVGSAGIGPYTASMVAVLFDRPAVPIDTNVARVGGRAAPAGDFVAWMHDLMCGALAAGPGAAYRVTSAVLSIGARTCAIRQPACHRCPLSDGCVSNARSHRSAA